MQSGFFDVEVGLKNWLLRRKLVWDLRRPMHVIMLPRKNLKSLAAAGKEIMGLLYLIFKKFIN